MSKTRTIFVCSECGYETGKWLGKCPGCNMWNTFIEEKQQSRSKPIPVSMQKAVPVTDIIKDAEDRQKTGISELDRVLGGYCSRFDSSCRRGPRNRKVNSFAADVRDASPIT